MASPLDHSTSPIPSPLALEYSSASPAAFGRSVQPCDAVDVQENIAQISALLGPDMAVVGSSKGSAIALRKAALNGHTETVKSILKQGVSPNAKSASSGQTALLLAAEEGHVACLEALLDAGADINHSDTDGLTALFCAADAGHLQALELLLERGSRVDGWRCCEDAPLCIATLNGHLACVKALLAAHLPCLLYTSDAADE